MKKQRSLSRRQFLQAATASAVGVLAASCAPAPEPTPAAAPTVEKAAPTAIPAPTKVEGNVVLWDTNQSVAEFIVDAFNEADLGITAEFEVVNKNDMQKLFAVLAAGSPPDIAFRGLWQSGDMAVRNAIYCLDELIANARNFKWDDLWTRNRQYATLWGKKWMVPLATETRAFFYNRAVMKEVGLDPDTPPTTWAEVEEMSVACTKKDEGGRLDQIGFSPSFGNPPTHLFFCTMVWCLGSDLADAERVNSTLLDKGVEAMAIIKELMDAQGGYEDALAFTKALAPGEGLDAFSLGKVAFAMNGNWAVRRYDQYSPDLDYGMIPGPVVEGYDEHANYDGGNGYYLYKEGRSKNLAAAWELIEFTMEDEFYMELVNFSNMMPSRSDLIDRWTATDERRKIFADTAPTCQWIPVHVGALEPLAMIAKMYENVLLKDAPIKDELEALQVEHQKILDKHASYTPPSC